ncbi:protein SHQ1 homolog [Engraulis encrasicolus]|uniref:protein SHQ1 homolog n=1 Tax=Engraulis encrasicolus TaxID=184585 RepID=UPI002FD4FE4E
MLTPAFELSQEPDFLTLVIRVPYTRTSEFDLYIDGDDFKFYAKPYFLRLTLPGRIVEDGREKGSFDIDKGVFTLRVPKESPGQHFKGLQMLTSLLAPRGARSAKPLVEELDLGPCEGATGAELGTEGGGGGDEEQGDEEDEEEEEFDWQVEQTAYCEQPEEELQRLQKYGFGNLRSGVFTRLQEELSDVIDVKDPDGTSPAARRRARLEAERNKFDADHYLADLFEDEVIQSLLRFRPWWRAVSSSSGCSSDQNQAKEERERMVVFSEEEKDQMRRFSNRGYLLDKASRRQVWLGLLDILLAYAYEIRVTEGEHSVESPWNIRKLSGTLCWLETYQSVQEVLVSFGRRVLCYPLHRHFGLATAALQDAVHILQAGKACVLKCLLDIHKIFRENDPAYILNDLYITDYCVWIQRVKSKHVSALLEPLQKATLRKSDLELELDELEAAAALVEGEEEEDEDEGDEEEDEDGSSSEEEEEEEEEEESDSSDDSSSSSSSSSEDEDSDDCVSEQLSAACVIVNQPLKHHQRMGKNNNIINSSSSPSQQPSPLYASTENQAPTLTPAPSIPLVVFAPSSSPLSSLAGGGGGGGGTESQRSGRLLIEELGEQLEEGLRITGAAAQPEEAPPTSSTTTSARSTEPECKRQPEGEGEGEGKQNEEKGRSEPAAHTHSSSAVRSERTLLASGPHRNPLLLVVDTAKDQEDILDSDDQEEPDD